MEYRMDTRGTLLGYIRLLYYGRGNTDLGEVDISRIVQADLRMLSLGGSEWKTKKVQNVMSVLHRFSDLGCYANKQNAANANTLKRSSVLQIAWNVTLILYSKPSSSLIPGIPK